MRWNLSDRIVNLEGECFPNGDFYFIDRENVEHFIRRLKLKIKELDKGNGYVTVLGLTKFINKLAGDKLQ